MKVLLGTWRDHHIELNEQDMRRLEAGEILKADGVEIMVERHKFTELPKTADGRRRFLREGRAE